MERSERLRSVEAARGLAALAVTWFHLTNSYPPGPANASGGYGWLGVDAFFVISGFVIPYSLHAGEYRLRNFFRFFARRMVRLEPPFVASVLLVVALNMLSSRLPGFGGVVQNYTLGQLFSHLLYVIPLTSFNWIQPVYWSLAYEFVFYIVVGLSFSFLWPRNIVLTLLAAGAFVLVKFGVTATWDARILLFVLGIAAARRYVGRDNLMTYLGCLALCVVAMIAMGSVLNALVGLSTALLVALLRLPAWRPLTFLASISYSLYLTHVPIGGRIISFGRRFGAGTAYEFALSVTALGISLFFAWAFYRLFEATATRWSRRIAMRGRPPKFAEQST